MIDYATARQLALDQIARMNKTTAPDFQVVLVEQSTLEEDIGWIFFYDCQRFLETADPAYAIAGNAPLLIDRRDGSLHTIATAYPVETYITAYREQREEQHQTWELVIEQLGEAPLKTYQHIRAVLGLSPQAFGKLRPHIPGVVDRGGRQRLSRLAKQLQERGVQVELRPHQQ